MPKSPPTNPQPDRDRFVLPALAAVMLVAVALRFYNLGGPSLWSDEFLTLGIASGPVDTIARAVRQAEQTPPLLHYFMHYWISAYGVSEFALRVPFALCGVGAVWMTYRLARLLYTPREGVVAAALMAVSSFQITYSQEARVYAPFMLVALWSCCAFVRLIRTGGRKHQISYVLATGLLYWLHLYAVFVVAAQMVAWAFTYLRRTHVAGDDINARPTIDRQGADNDDSATAGGASRLTPRIWLTCTLVALALFAPWMPTVLQWVGSATQSFWIQPMTRWFLPQTYAQYAGSAVLLACLLALDVLGMVKTRRRWKSVFLVALLTFPVVIPYVVSLTVRPLFVHRYGIAAAAGLFILAARGCTALPGRAARGFVLLALLALSAVSVYPALRDGPANKPDVRSATAFVARAAHPGDVILLNSYANSIFVYYLRDTDTTQYRMAYDPQEIPPAGSVPPDTQLYTLSLRGPDGNYPTAYKSLAADRGWQFQDTREFHGVLMDRFTRK